MEENLNLENETRMPLIGDKAPSFMAETTQGNINFPDEYKGKWIVFFSHPSDFTPVCSTEFMTFANDKKDFDNLGVQLVGLSADGLYSHIAWLRKLHEFTWKDIKNPQVVFPLIADPQLIIARKYGMVHHQSTNSTVRAIFIIDPKSIIRAILYYPASAGRNIDEIKRLVTSLQRTDRDGVATPANWEPGDDVIAGTPGTCAGAKAAVNNKDKKCLDWFLCFQADKK